MWFFYVVSSVSPPGFGFFLGLRFLLTALIPRDETIAFSTCGDYQSIVIAPQRSFVAGELARIILVQMGELKARTSVTRM